jgi:hypothetical protein
VGTETAEKPGVCDEAPPAGADGGGAGKGGRLRRETEQDLPEHVVVDRQGRRRRGRGRAAAATAGPSGPVLLIRADLGKVARDAAAGRSGAILLTRLDLGMAARDAAAGRSGSLLARVDGGMVGRAAAAGHLRDLVGVE